MPATKETDMNTTNTAATGRNILAQTWDDERTAARAARKHGDAAGEWRHLERAHILSQPLAVPHLRTHAAMLAYGVRHRDRREVLGQVVRLMVAAPGSWTGRYPPGNPGGAAVSALESMPIPNDLQVVLDAAG
jgi:hypothetical protein